MGKNSKGAMGGAVSGATAGASVGGPWGAVIGGVAGGLMGANTGGGDPEQVQQIDPAFMNHLYAQSMGTEQTAADLKMKSAFDQTLAQQVAAARAARGVNPGLLQRNVSRVAAEQGARSAQMGAEENLKNQDDARSRYLQALGLNQNAQRLNSASGIAAEERDSKRTGSLINAFGGMAAAYGTAKSPEAKPAEGKAIEGSAFDAKNYSADSSSTAQRMPDYSLGANQSINVPTYDMSAPSDKNVKNKIKSESLKVVSDERQKDLIKAESLPTAANGGLAAPNQQAAQQPVPSMQQQIQTNMAPVPGPAMPAPAAAPAVQPPAPVPASQTALAQANTSLAKGGQINDLSLQDTSQLVKPADGPSQQEILAMSTNAQRDQKRDIFGNVTQSDAENYRDSLGQWFAKQATDRAAYTQKMDEAKAANMGIQQERSARLAKFYTGNSNMNANDLAQHYAPKVVTPNSSWQSAQQAQAAAGIGDQSRGTQAFQLDAIKKAGQYSLSNRLSESGRWLPGGQSVADTMQSGVRAVSDENSKTEIKSESNKSPNADMNPKHFLDKLNAYSYEYKQGQKQNPAAGEGKYLSVMAQDLEKAGPVGASMVETDENGMKNVSYGKGFGAILAAQVHLNERLKQIEAKKK